MTHDEKRAIRRGFINAYLHDNRDAQPALTLGSIKWYVRFLESVNFGQELRAY